MSQISIPYHLLFPALLAVGALILIVLRRKKFFQNPRANLFWFSVVCFLSIYLLIVGSAAAISVYNQYELSRYDLDSNGLFHGDEITDSQQLAMKKVIADSGRNFSFIVGAIVSFLAAIIVYGLGRIYLFLRRYSL